MAIEVKPALSAASYAEQKYRTLLEVSEAVNAQLDFADPPHRTAIAWEGARS